MCIRDSIIRTGGYFDAVSNDFIPLRQRNRIAGVIEKVPIGITRPSRLIGDRSVPHEIAAGIKDTDIYNRRSRSVEGKGHGAKFGGETTRGDILRQKV